MHSHWYCRKNSTVVFRGVSFEKHEVSFIVIKQNSDLCYRVQENDAKCHWMELCKEEKIKNLNRLVIEKIPNSCKVANILKKFELDRELIHVYSADAEESTLIFELPRFDFSFSLMLNQGNDYVIKSNNYRGFHLSRQQLLDDTLRGFKQYLRLESEIGEQMILIPSGTVGKVE